MALDAKAKSALARKAANVGAEIRRAKDLDRNENICLAFRYLTEYESLGITEKSLAFNACLKLKCGVKLQPGESALRLLADATGKTRQRISQIIEKGEVALA